MIKGLRKWLIDPRVLSLDVDGIDYSVAHRQVLLGKAMLRCLFERFYRECRALDLRYFGDCPGERIEIGSGAGLIKETYPDVVTSDVKHLPFIDVVLNAEHMPFSANSLRAVYGMNVLHHIPDIRAFFHELLRVLSPGGGVILIEPYHGPLARFVFSRLHASEGFDPGVCSWDSATRGPFSGANQALSYVIFQRDRSRFLEEFSDLNIVVDRPHTHLLYLLSGGVNFRQLVPDCLTSLVVLAEQVLAPLNPLLALQHTIVLRKSCRP